MSNQVNPAIEKSLKTAIKTMQIISIIVVIAILFSGITFVQEDEVAVI